MGVGDYEIKITYIIVIHADNSINGNKIKIRRGGAKMIKTVIRLKDNSVMVFDKEGEQLPQYQGRYESVREKILNDAPAGTVFNHWFGHSLKPGIVACESW